VNDIARNDFGLVAGIVSLGFAASLAAAKVDRFQLMLTLKIEMRKAFCSLWILGNAKLEITYRWLFAQLTSLQPLAVVFYLINFPL
jgi:hypothetical protein